MKPVPDVRVLPVQRVAPLVAGVHSPSSLGVSRYCSRLAVSLAEHGLDYELCDRPLPGRATHLHLANSSRLPAARARRGKPFALTLHDVRPRTRALEPVYRTLVYPLVVERAAVTVVHSRFAADLLRDLGVRPRRVEVIPHAAAVPASLDRSTARSATGLDDGRLLAVLPGVVKQAKLVHEAVAAFESVRRRWRLVLVGRVDDRRTAARARRAGVDVVEHPVDRAYEQAIVAADVVLCLRSASVGETNGPLLDALGAGRPVLATSTGSIPEVAGRCARFVEPTAKAIAHGLRALEDEGERRELRRAAFARADELSWSRAAALHAELFSEVFDA